MRISAASAHGKRALLAAATVALDKGIALLQGLRERTGDSREGDARRENVRPGKRATARRLQDDPAAEAAVAPKPRRRLRGLLVYLSVMLAGGALGTALAYDLLGQLLERRAVEIQRKEAKLSGYSKSVAELKKALQRQQAQRTEMEARLTASLAESARKLGELQAQRAQAEARPANAPDARAGGWSRSGNCTLVGGDVRAVLAGCIADMNRK